MDAPRCVHTYRIYNKVYSGHLSADALDYRSKE